jgi:hypothetical protein
MIYAHIFPPTQIPFVNSLPPIDEIFSETVIPGKLPILELDLDIIFVKSKSVTRMYSLNIPFSFTPGSIPVVVGTPNIQEFSPGEGVILHIKELDDVASAAKTIKNIASNLDAFNQSLR